MDSNILNSILAKYNIHHAQVEPFGTGLINHTWNVQAGDKRYILQKINQKVFPDPGAIASNISAIANYLAEHAPGYFFVGPEKTCDGLSMVHIPEADAYYRLFPFVNDSHSKNVATSAGQAFEAAAQFGRFTRLLSGFPVDSLQITLPHFHDLSLRYRQFLDALENGNKERIADAARVIEFLKEQSAIVEQYALICKDPLFKKRVTHHDTKISNVLFNSSDKAICVIDLDTLMPGYFISDVGDMMRTYLPTVSEEETDLDKIDVREDIYQAIVAGYFAEMKDELTTTESKYFFYAGKFMIYMQALRFLTDHLNNDVYYGAKYPGHNFVRASNQAVLLKKLLEKAGSLHSGS